MNDVADRQKQIDKVLKSDFSKRLVDEIRKSESLMNSLDTSVKSIADSQLKNLQKEVTAFKQELTPSDLQKHQNQLSNLENKINKTKERTVDLKEEKDETKEKQITDKSKDDLAKEKQEEKVKSRSHEVTLER
jgi:murein L,D-transpeptidase YafK